MDGVDLSREIATRTGGGDSLGSRTPALGIRWCRYLMPGAWLTKVNALIAFYLPNASLRENAGRGVTGYDQATLIWSGPGRPQAG